MTVHSPDASRSGSGLSVRTRAQALRESLRTLERRIRVLRKRMLGQSGAGPPVHQGLLGAPAVPAAHALVPRVLIVAESSIPQCLKYRVLQRQEAFESLGVECTWISWTDILACRAALQTRSHLILYRVPAHRAVLNIVDEARRLGVPTAWECDDLVFDRSVLERSRALARLPTRTARSLVEGADLYRRAMLACDVGIASTPELAAAMRDAGMRTVHVVENCLDRQTLDAASALSDRRPPFGDRALVRIVYGSGSSTHDVDFEEAAPAIARLLDRHGNLRLRIVGPLALPDALARHGDSIERFAPVDFERYLALLAECDISIAPLEDFVFNACKSSIKYLEASILKLPTVCSALPAFERAIVHGQNGLLCRSVHDWEESLDALVQDPDLRRRVGDAACARVRESLDIQRVARTQVAPLLGEVRGRDGPRVLSANVFYAPRSFGGATLVAERMNRLLRERHGFAVDVFTTIPASAHAPYALLRYEAGGLNVFGMGLPDGAHDRHEGFESPDAARCFGEVLDATRPDVVHLHSIQGIGIGAADACRDRGIPYVITLHDAWWICERQFMIARDGQYCGQTRIDPSVCARCVDSPARNEVRMRRARGALANAALVLAPSQFFANLHAENGFTRVTVNRNGIARPKGGPRIRRAGPVRFGYVGGNTPIKGFHVIRDVFRSLGAEEAELVLVDNTITLGFTSFDRESLRGLPRVEVKPAYSATTMDEFFAGIDVLLFPTRWKESFGLTVREALVRHVWVIASDGGGVSEDIRPGVNGAVIPFGDDGAALRTAVLDAIERFRTVPPGAAVTLDGSGIRHEEQQADELAGMLRSCVESHSARSATGRVPIPDAHFTGPLIVCGMHRSCTSLMASILEGAGVHLGDVLLGPSDANPHGHFEDCSILDFHRRALLAQGIASEGYTTQARIPISGRLRREAERIIARRKSSQCMWGWKEPRTTLFLDFWRDLTPHAQFVLLFRRPWEVADSLFRRREAAFEANPMLAIDVWVRYNRALLDFAQTHPSQCLLIEASQVVHSPDAVLESVRRDLGMPLQRAPRKLDGSLVRTALGAEHAAILHAARPDAFALYLELRSRAGSGSPLPAVDVLHMPARGSAEDMITAWEVASRRSWRPEPGSRRCPQAQPVGDPDAVQGAG